MSDEAPKPDPDPTPPQPPAPPSPEVRKARAAERARLDRLPRGGKTPGLLTTKDLVLGWVCITTVTGMVLAVAIPGLCSSTRGARYSVRLQWERREAEIDAIVEQARRDGKLPPEPEKKPRE